MRVAGLVGFACCWAEGLRAQELLLDGAFELSEPNGSFPSSGAWRPSHLPTAGAVVTSTAGRSGNGLWLFTGETGGDWWSAPFQQVEVASSGWSYRARAWLRVPDGDSWVPGSRARVQVSFLDQEEYVVSSYDGELVTSADSGWTECEVITAAAPLGTAYVRLVCLLEKPNGTEGQSVVNLDDCSLERIAAPVVRVSSRAVGFGIGTAEAQWELRNVGSAPLSWTIAGAPVWLAAEPNGGNLAAGQVQSVRLRIDRTGLAGSGTLRAGWVLRTNGGDVEVDAYVDRGSGTVPNQPAVAECVGRQLRVRDRLPDGSLSEPYHYIVNGVAWSPASMATTDHPDLRRLEFEKWYVADIQLLSAMNANTVYTFLDFGTEALARELLDYLFHNGMKAIVTVDENGSANSNRVEQVVTAYRDHPAILAWAIGNEWNINLYHTIKPGDPVTNDDLEWAAEITEALAQQVKRLDRNHPVVSIFGDIDVSDAPLAMPDIVNGRCPTVDLWGLNVYRGATFGSLFEDWERLTTKPMFLSEYGTDVFRTVKTKLVDGRIVSADGSPDERMQAEFVAGLWAEIEANLSAKRYENVCVGGTVFEWNDEWWKADSPTGETVGVHDNLGFFTWWNPEAMPDSVANEEWFAIVGIDRRPRLAYAYLQSAFAGLDAPSDLDADGLRDAWEYAAIDRDLEDAFVRLIDIDPDEDSDSDGVKNRDEFEADTDPLASGSKLGFTGIAPTAEGTRVSWRGGVESVQYLERSSRIGATADWIEVFRNGPPTSIDGVYLDREAPPGATRIYRLRVER